LQDKLPPFPAGCRPARGRDRDGAPLDALFTEFSEPVAAASIAQVHKARLAGTDRDVAVKILRPGVERAFRKDIDAFYLIAWVIETLSPASRRLRPRDVIAHFEGVVMQELDLRIESSAAGEFAANTEGDAGFRRAAGGMVPVLASGDDAGLGRGHHRCRIWRHRRGGP
jgi:ubiquinone biosynthesis protein